MAPFSNFGDAETSTSSFGASRRSPLVLGCACRAVCWRASGGRTNGRADPACCGAVRAVRGAKGRRSIQNGSVADAVEQADRMPLRVRQRDLKRAFEEFKGALERCGVDAQHLRLARRFHPTGRDRVELREHGNVLPWYVIKNTEPQVVARAVSPRDALNALSFATEVLRFVERRRPH
jgi:hypothetical protein